MKERTDQLLSKVLIGREEFLELLFIIILLGFAISIIAASITQFFVLEPKYWLLIGIAISLLPFVYFVRKHLFSKRIQERTLTGMLIHHLEKTEKFDANECIKTSANSGDLKHIAKKNFRINEIVKISRYHFNECAVQLFQAGYKESSEIEKQWILEVGCKDYKQRAQEILAEITSGYIIYELSNHLVNYVRIHKLDESKLDGFTQNDLRNIPGVLPYLDQLLKNKHKVEGGIDQNGLPFILKLPNGSKVIRNQENTCGFTVDTKQLEISFTTSVSYREIGLSSQFSKFYLGKDNSRQCTSPLRTYRINIRISVALTWRSFLPFTRWKDYRWLDSFIEDFNNSFSEAKFYERIGWDTAVTVIEGNINYEKSERARLRNLKQDREMYLKTETLVDWLLNFHHKKEGTDLRKLNNFGKQEVAFMSNTDWDAPTDLVKISPYEKQTILKLSVDAPSSFNTDDDLIEDREAIGQEIWNSPTLYLHRVEGKGKDIEFTVSTCDYFEVASQMIRLEDETIKAIKCGDSAPNCYIREKYYLKIKRDETGDLKLFRPMTLGCMVVFALNVNDCSEILLQTRSRQNATANMVYSIAPTFGLSPFLGEPPDNNMNLLFYNFLKEYLEEFFNQEELIQPFDTRTAYDSYYGNMYDTDREEVKIILEGDFNLYYLGFGFNLINGFPNIGLLAELNSEKDSQYIIKNIRPNWEIASHAQLGGVRPPIDRVRINDNKKLNDVFKKIEPAGAFFLDKAIDYLKAKRETNS